jgi:MFS family permease
LSTTPSDRAAGRHTFRMLLTVHLISEIGASMTILAMPWFVLQLTGSATLTGLSGGALAAAAISAGFFGGVLVDRFGYKRTSVLADAFSAIAIVMVPLLYASVGINFLGVLVLIFFARLLDVPVLTARRSMVPEIAAKSDIPLERANSMFEGCMHIALLIGPVSAGLLISVLGTANVFLVAGALIGAAALLSQILLPVEEKVEVGQSSKPAGVIGDFLEGVRYIRGDSVVLSLLIAIGAVNMVTYPLVGVILPVYADEVLGSAAQLGVLISIYGVGVLTGTLVYGWVGHRIPRRPLWLIAHAALPLPMIGLMLELQLVPLIPFAIITAVLFGPINPILVTVRHERVPIQLRGRVFAAFSSVAMTCSPLGAMLAGFAIDTFGRNATMAGIIAIIAVGWVLMVILPVFKRMERPVSTPAT